MKKRSNRRQGGLSEDGGVGLGATKSKCVSRPRSVRRALRAPMARLRWRIEAKHPPTQSYVAVLVGSGPSVGTWLRNTFQLIRPSSGTRGSVLNGPPGAPGSDYDGTAGRRAAELTNLASCQVCFPTAHAQSSTLLSTLLLRIIWR